MSFMGELRSSWVNRQVWDRYFITGLIVPHFSCVAETAAIPPGFLARDLRVGFDPVFSSTSGAVTRIIVELPGRGMLTFDQTH
jgi:hypothetical protein